MPVFILWIALSFLAGYIAQEKGRSGIGFFFLALILSPLVGIIAALVVAAHEKPGDVALRVGNDGKLEAVPSTRPCPYCAEDIKPEAIVCKHCSRDIPPVGAEATINEKALDVLVSNGAFVKKLP